MQATFTYAVRYRVYATCRTPLRTGGADGDTELVLTNSKGRPMIQGSSLAGAMRAWVQQTHGTAMAEALFGSQKRAGHLIVSDGTFNKDFEQSVRPRLKIDPKTGSAAEGQKFDLAQINAGASFHFTLTWLGQGDNTAERGALEETLAALNEGEIYLGGQKSNGFGRVVLAVKKQTYDMKQEQGRTAWLQMEASELEDMAAPQASKTPPELTLPKERKQPRVTFTLTGTADSILVKSSAVEYGKEGHSCTPNLAEREHPLPPKSADGTQEQENRGTPILPGSSVKGAVRAQAERIAQRTGREALVEELFGRGSIETDNGKAGRLRFEDAKLEEAQPQKITRIRINRFTGGVIRAGLFKEEPLKSKVTLTITAPADCKEGCALLLYALRDLGLGLYNLGSGGAIGRGYLNVKTLTAESVDRTVTLTFSEGGGYTVSDPDGLAAEWMKAWKEAAK
ncbi:MAG: RAMP superfamily CRISPR-associated protein [Clostridiales bacterium]|nr:RAMP superfamily CRISPR-associated protein [Clostridiales bacterium]MCC8098986.1 RAMP superfamily CRISPR-associated protein [Clostridiales bacterium]